MAVFFMVVVAILHNIALHQRYVVMTMVFAMMVVNNNTSTKTRGIWIYD
jgi:hypothetical protein